MATITISGSNQNRFANLGKSILQTLAVWRKNRRARRQLALISPRDLRDACLSIGVVDYELRQPAWKPLRNSR